ncbi:MAG: hypothetical protein KKD18_04880 [Nanoarchaeota archaeon]|nr:hypothetical protein [Nanoarchaeota archaeon]MBU0977725.1 hypothetical protein [Nanoarchaeota archaeon]
MNRKQKHSLLKIVLSALAVAVFGFILLNATFLFDFLYQSLLNLVVTQFVRLNPDLDWSWYPPLKHLSFVVVIGLISWEIFSTKLKLIYKAIYMTVPTAVVLVSVGMFLYRWPIVAYSLGALLVVGTLFWFYRTKQPWIYYYTVILVGVALGVFTLMGGEI